METGQPFVNTLYDNYPWSSFNPTEGCCQIAPMIISNGKDILKNVPVIGHSKGKWSNFGLGLWLTLILKLLARRRYVPPTKNFPVPAIAVTFFDDAFLFVLGVRAFAPRRAEGVLWTSATEHDISNKVCWAIWRF